MFICGYKAVGITDKLSNPISGITQKFFNYAKSKSSIFESAFSIEKIDIKKINLFLIVLSPILFFYFWYDFSTTRKELNEREIVVPKVEFRGASASRLPIKLKDISYYLKEANKRNIFQKVKKKEPAVKNTVQEALKIEKLVQSLVLVGISLGAEPQVMIEDKQTKETSFLGEGDYVGEVKIEKIYRDGVILSYEGETYELK